MKKQNQKKLQNNSNLDLNQEIISLKLKIEQLEKRNAEKDDDKAWEVSKERKLLIGLFTYFVMVILMGSIGVENPHISAIVPTSGFLLSTLSLSLFKMFWRKN